MHVIRVVAQNVSARHGDWPRRRAVLRAADAEIAAPDLIGILLFLAANPRRAGGARAGDHFGVRAELTMR